MREPKAQFDTRSPMIAIAPELCTGCRTCELACSLHHTGTMSPELSSVQIRRSNRTAAISWQVLATCDLCANEEEPLCVKYCGGGAIRVPMDA